MNQQAKYKLIGFVMMFASSSLMGGIGAFTRFIDAPGDFVSFWRNFAGLIALSLIFCFVGGSWKKIKETRFSGMMLLSGVFLGLLSGLYCLSTQYTTLANASFLIYTGPIYSTILAAIFLKEKLNIKGVLCIAAANLPILFFLSPIFIFPSGRAPRRAICTALFPFFRCGGQNKRPEAAVPLLRPEKQRSHPCHTADSATKTGSQKGCRLRLFCFVVRKVSDAAIS